MRILVACEYSGIVRDAFRTRGHQAISCDLHPTERPGPHFQGDVRQLLLPNCFDLLVAFPDCTYLCASGLHWNTRRPGRAEKTEKALAFVRTLLSAPIPRIALENPIGCISTRIGPPSQIVQPWQYGDDASKATCLWLQGLPLLVSDPANHVPPRYVCQECGHVMRGYTGACSHCGCERVRERWGNQTDSGQNKLAPSADRWRERSRTYRGIANAMALTWG